MKGRKGTTATAQPTKKAKAHGAAPSPAEVKALVDRAWDHLGDYLAEGEVDELQECLDILKISVEPTTLSDIFSDAKTSHLQDFALLPVFLSVVRTLLADESIAALSHATTHSMESDPTEQLKEIQDHLCQALTLFPDNAATLVTATNFIRMTAVSHASAVTPLMVELAHCFVAAAETASRVRTATLASSTDSGTDPSDTNASDEPQSLTPAEEQGELWRDVLLLNQVAGVEMKPPDRELEVGDIIEFEPTPSSVEGTARFMAAMLYSMRGEHELARDQLKAFGITHRIHPHVWQHVMSPSSTIATTNVTLDNAAFAPVSYASVVPEALHRRLCKVFEPHATFWTESEYARRGYFSFYANVPDSVEAPSFQPSNLLEDIVCRHLLPLARAQTDDAIVGYEWWVHTRSVAANLGHNLHFDTDEAMLQQTGTVSHPIVSSVLYVTGGQGGGATVIFDQEPDSANAPAAWCSRPVDNAFLLFPGNLLHGALPCLGDTVAPPATGTTTQSANTEQHRAQLMRTLQDSAPRQSITDTTPHRLTLMVGFWTRRVPDDFVKDEDDDEDNDEDDDVYGPCRPLPSTETAWVSELQQGYKDKVKSDTTVASSSGLVKTLLPLIAPAWEEFVVEDNDELKIPRAIDHKFFVVDAPECFSAALHDKQQIYGGADYIVLEDGVSGAFMVFDDEDGEEDDDEEDED